MCGIFRGGIFSVGKIPGGEKVGGDYSWWGMFRGVNNRGGMFRGEFAGHRLMYPYSWISDVAEEQ